MISWSGLHPEAWALIQSARREQRLAHALLLSGQAGIGKLAFAEAVAASLLCEQPAADGVACGQCTPCRWLAAGSHPDFRRVRPEAFDDSSAEGPEDTGTAAAKSERKKSEQIRIDQVRRLEPFIQVGSHRGRRVILIEPAEAMNEATANALLKSLEEPPAGVHFLLVSHAPERLLPTVRSRTRKISLVSPQAGQALALFAQCVPPLQQGALWLNRCAGAVRFALALAQAAEKLPDASEEATIEVAIVNTLLEQLPRGHAIDVVGLAKSCESLIKGDQSGMHLGRLIDWLQRWFLDLQWVAMGEPPLSFPECHAQLEQLVALALPERFGPFADALLENKALSTHPLNIRLFLESLWIQYASLFKTKG